MSIAQLLFGIPNDMEGLDFIEGIAMQNANAAGFSDGIMDWSAFSYVHARKIQILGLCFVERVFDFFGFLRHYTFGVIQ